MKFESGRTYIMRNGKKAKVTSVGNGVVTGYYSTPKAVVTTKWFTDGRHAAKNKTQVDIVAPYEEQRAPDPSVAVFTKKAVDERIYVKGYVAVCNNPPEQSYPYFKTHAFTTLDALHRNLDKRGLSSRLIRVVEVKEVRVVEEYT